jgi:uncharacterized protein (DUF58 family)
MANEREKAAERQRLKERLARVRRIEITAQRLVNEQLSGRYHSVFKGRGMSFDEVRPYSPGDEPRLIDWNVSARTGEVFVKRFTEERELNVLILADASLSMDFGLSAATFRSARGMEDEELTKQGLAAQIGAAIALSAQRNNDRVGLLVFGSDVQTFIPPRKGRQHALRVIREILEMRSAGAPTDLAGALAYVGRVMKRRAAVFILSDFLAPDFEERLRVSVRRHDVHAFVIADPVEQTLFPGGIVTMRDLETGRLMPVATDAGFLARYREIKEADDRAVAQVFKRLRVPFTRFSTGAAYDRPLAGHFARLKGKTL